MATPELNKALAAFQAELPKIPKNSKGEIKGVNKQGERYSYEFDYAALEDVNDETLPGLGKQGLSLTGAITTDDQGRIVYEYTLLHESGEERGPWQFPLWMLLPDRYTAQTIGGYITYARRYVIGPVTGIAPGGQDIDATGAEEVSRPDTGGRWMNRRPDVPPAHLQEKRTPTKTTGADLEQLRAGTVEAAPEDRPAQRVRAGQNGGDLWQDQPPGHYDETPPEERTGSIDGRQRSQIFAKFTVLGITDATAQREILSGILRRPVDSRKGLSYRDAETVLKDLQGRVEAKEAAEEAAQQDAAAETAP